MCQQLKQNTQRPKGKHHNGGQAEARKERNIWKIYQNPSRKGEESCPNNVEWGPYKIKNRANMND